MGRKAKKSTLTEKVVEVGDQALPRIEAARDALVAELAPHVSGAGRKARKQFAAATALATASVEVARHALAPAPPAKKPRRGKKLALLLALAGIGGLVFKNLRPSPEPASYKPTSTAPPLPDEPPVPPAPVEEPVEEPVVEEAAAEEPVAEREPEPVAAQEPVVEEPEAAQEPEPVAEEPEQAPVAPAESLNSFFDEVLSETEAAKKRKR